MGKHDKTNFEWTEPVVINYEPPKDDFYKARISTLERENFELHKEIEKRAKWYGMGKDAFDARHEELANEVTRLREENEKLRKALVREAISNV